MEATRDVIWSFVAISAANGKVLSFGDAMQEFRGLSEEKQQDAIAMSRSHGEANASCRCDVCDRLRAGETWEDIANHFIGIINRSREEVGFIVQYVTTDRCPYGVDIRTKGLVDDAEFGREVQIVLKLSGHVACKVLICFAEVVRKNNLVLSDGLRVEHVIGHGWPVKVVSVDGDNGPLWRLIMPDRDGAVDLADFVAKKEGFERQYDGVSCSVKTKNREVQDG